MSFASYLWNGPSFADNVFRRENYLSDLLKASEEPSYSYEGKITSTSSDGSVRVIDNVSTFSSVSQKRRNETLSKWNGMFSKSLISTAVNTAVCATCAFSLYPIAYPIAVGVSSGVLATWSLVRTVESYEEWHKWVDPIEGLQSLRRSCATDFLSLRQMDLSNRLFAQKETQNIFVGDLMRKTNAFQEVIFQGEPFSLVAYTRNFFENGNLLSVTCIDYAFPHETLISDPSNHFPQRWKRATMYSIANDTQRLAITYIRLRNQQNGQMEEVDDFNGAAHLGIAGAHIIADDVIETTGNAEERKSRKQVANTATLLAHGATSIYSELQRNQIEREMRTAFINQFSNPLSQIFNRLKNEQEKQD